MSETEAPSDEWRLAEDEFGGGDGPSTAVFVTMIAAALVAALGVAGYVSGVGWFGYRQWLYGTGRLYLGNYTPHTRFVSVDGRDPVELGPNKYEIVDFVGGTNSVRVLDADRELLSTHSLTAAASDAFFKVAGGACLAVVDVSSLYGGEGEIEIREFVGSDQRSYVPDTHNTIWPGEEFPDQLQAGEGPGIWLEKVGCPLEEDRDVLRKYLEVRVRDRMSPDEPQRMGPPGPSN